MAHFHVKPFDGQQLARQVPRADNSAADAAANRALDVGTFLDVRVDEAVRFMRRLSEVPDATDIGLLFAFDGAAQSNPGPAASGVCAHGGAFGEIKCLNRRAYYYNVVFGLGLEQTMLLSLMAWLPQ